MLQKKSHVRSVKDNKEDFTGFFVGDKLRRASGRAPEGRAADGRGEAEEADAEEEPRVRLPDPPGEDGAAAPGAPGTSTFPARAPLRTCDCCRSCHLPIDLPLRREMISSSFSL